MTKSSTVLSLNQKAEMKIPNEDLHHVRHFLSLTKDIIKYRRNSIKDASNLRPRLNFFCRHFLPLQKDVNVYFSPNRRRLLKLIHPAWARRNNQFPSRPVLDGHKPVIDLMLVP
jgi:hypothetical protein